MLTRRAFALLLLATPLARAGTPAPELWSGTLIDKPERGSIAVAGRHVRLRNRAKPTETVMVSAANDNQTFTFWVVLPHQHEGDYQYLKLGGTWWSSNGTGRDREGTKTTFELDRADARRIAAAFRIPLHERTRLDGGLRYTWRFPAQASLDTTLPIPVVLRVENTGKTPVGFMIGGRQRGPRDNRFGFAIARNGKPIALKDGPDFGGLGSYHPIAPGKHLDVTCADLRAWADLDQPGYYTIDARYEGELAATGIDLTKATTRARVWDIAATGQGSILVR